MWASAIGVVVGQDHEEGCVHQISRRWAHWYKHHGSPQEVASLRDYPGDVGLSFHGEHPDVERVYVSRPTFSARLEDWLDLGSRCHLRAETMLADGWKRHSYSREPYSPERDTGHQPLQSENEIGVHAYTTYGASAMALLRPAWLRHGWHIVAEWDDVVAGVPVIRQRATRIVSLSDVDMMGHEFNPLVFRESEEVVFAYDPEYDVMREWHNVWNGAPCTSYRFASLTFRDTEGVGNPYLLGNE